MDFSWFWSFIVATVFVGVCAGGWWAYRDGLFAGAWRWLRVLSLGGATTLDRDLNYTICTFCRYGMLAGEKVRTLSCDHVFHRKCVNGIDTWLRTAPRMICPTCDQTLHSVLPWKGPPPFLLEEQPTPPSLPPVSTTSETPQSSSGYGNEISPPQSSSGLEGTSPPYASPRSYDVVIEVRPPQSSSGSENTSPPESSSGLDDLGKPLLSRSPSA